ncbi:MAG: dihydrodipicolinate synthase family protein [Terracidiphilus sp.]|jgi:4-hydroxy-tetrahydrodipicolinate synthase
MTDQGPDLLTPAPGDFNGVFTPLLTPWDENGQVNESEIRRFVPWLIGKGIRGVYANGSIGEFPRLTSAERRRVVKVVCEAAAGRVPVLAGVGEANVAETLDACATYADYGARAVAVVSPFYYRLDASSVYAYFAELATHSPIDLVLYNIPAFASPIDFNTFRELAGFPRIIGIKDSTGDVGAMIKMITAVRPLRPEFAFLAGWEAVFAPMLAIGCNGGVLGSSNALPEILCSIFDAFRSGNLDRAVRTQYKLNPVFYAMLDEVPFPEGIRAAAQCRGFQFGKSRQPMTPDQEIELSARQQEIATAIKQLLTWNCEASPVGSR